MDQPIDFFAREVHFLEHLAPTYKALPEEARGRFYVHGSIMEKADELDIDATPLTEEDPPPEEHAGRLTVVAAYRDLKLARNLYGRPVVLSEHGAGQSYLGVESGSYIGAPDRDGVVAVLVPGQAQARRHLRAHPHIPAYPVGVPKLDYVHSNPRPLNDPPVVAISFHWNCALCPETVGAHSEYLSALRPLARKYKLLGHAHPRAMRTMARHYRQRRIEIVREFAEVIERADVYICDNSSTMFEWISLDRPVVVLNSQDYRKDVEHGMRFWEYADMGPNVWHHGALLKAVELAIEDPPEIADRRRQIAREVYGPCDGKAAQRAADALLEIQKDSRGIQRARSISAWHKLSRRR